MADVALVTYADFPEGFEDDHILVKALGRAGLSTAWVCWDDPSARWEAVGTALIRSTWDYHRRVAAFCDWADWVGSVTRLRNEASTIRWNAHKGYLLDLEAAGVAVVPTTLVPAGFPAPALADGAVVIKPAVSAGADRTVRGATQADLDALAATTDTLLQPYLAEVETAGEISLVCVAGEPLHAVSKVPIAGDFRSQEHHGAAIERIDLDDELDAFARTALAHVEPTPLYARVDVVRTRQGLVLMELELIEPTLWLRWAPETADVLAKAVAELS